MKKRKFLIYLLSGLIPVLIFFICSCIQGYLPFKDQMLNIYDSFTQYPGIILEYANLLRTGNIFYSWNAGLGFNFFGTMTYYAASPLNLLSLFATTTNYHMFVVVMTYLRFFLLGTSMCFYLSHKNIKPLYIVLFSVAYALMGYTSAYYYNYLWIDSIIMLPLVIHGLDKLIDKNKPCFYIVSLAITILINYYIGYMICIFCLLYFLYRLVTIKDKKSIVKTFLISSLLAGLTGAVVIIPSFFALMTGKAELYETVKYSGFSRNTTTFFYSLLSGTYQVGDQSYGPAQVYSSIMVIVLTVFYFFNTKYSKKEKIATAIILIIFYLSFSVNFINFAWHLFQKPIWWQSRFSFTFSFFCITIAAKSLTDIEKVKFPIRYRIILTILFFLAVAVGAYFKWQVVHKVETYTYFYLFFNAILFIECMFLMDKKEFLPLIIVFTILDISLNCFNNLECNKKYQSYLNYSYLKEELPIALDSLNKQNEYFYRFELMNDYTSDDGLYFNYHGLNYFNSVRNIKVIYLLESMGLKITDKCHVFLNKLDPVFLSLFNFKYLYGSYMDYFEEVDKRVFENPYPLAIGYMVEEKIKNAQISSDEYRDNLKEVLETMTDDKVNLYIKKNYSNFDLKNLYLDTKKKKISFVSNEEEFAYATYSFKSNGHYLLQPAKLTTTLTINGEVVNSKEYYSEVKVGDEVTIQYRLRSDIALDELFLYLLDLDEYETIMKELSTNTLKAKTYEDGHILKGEIEVSEESTYLFTTIEYEEGMKLYVDGKKVKPDIVLGTLIGTKLEPGKHIIWLDYTPKGLKSGAFISTISILLSGIYLQKKKKKL